MLDSARPCRPRASTTRPLNGQLRRCNCPNSRERHANSVKLGHEASLQHSTDLQAERAISRLLTYRFTRERPLLAERHDSFEARRKRTRRAGAALTHTGDAEALSSAIGAHELGEGESAGSRGGDTPRLGPQWLCLCSDVGIAHDAATSGFRWLEARYASRVTRARDRRRPRPARPRSTPGRE